MSVPFWPRGTPALLPLPSPAPGRKQAHPSGELRGILAGPGSSRKSSQTLHFLFSTAKWRNPPLPRGGDCQGAWPALDRTRPCFPCLVSHRLSRYPGLSCTFPGKDRHTWPASSQESASFLLHWGVGGGGDTPQVKSKASPRGPRGSALPTPPALKATRGTKLPPSSPPRGAREEPAAENSQARNSENPREACQRPDQTDHESAGSILAADQ